MSMDNRRRCRPNYETDDAAFPAAAYRVPSYPGVAWYVLGWETKPDGDTEWTGMENRTGQVIATMVGDDRRFAFPPEDLQPLDDDAYCQECGQIGCPHGR